MAETVAPRRPGRAGGRGLGARLAETGLFRRQEAVTGSELGDLRRARGHEDNEGV